MALGRKRQKTAEKEVKERKRGMNGKGKIGEKEGANRGI